MIKNTISTALRECGNLKSNPIYLVCMVVLPVVAILFFTSLMEQGQPSRMPLGVVDLDNTAFLPMLVASEKSSNRVPAKVLSPVAQYLLLFHLQVKSLEGLSAREIAPLVPYSYESVTLGLTCLTDVGLVEKIKAGQRSKVVHFMEKGRELWNKAQPYLTNPVDRRFYCDEMNGQDTYPECGINALAHYSRLNPDEERMLAMAQKEYSSLNSQGAFVRQNLYDGNYMIEVWKYQPIIQFEDDKAYVDKLSLVLSLKADEDPRVEGELEYIIERMVWKD